jgi:hypothetical protein
MSTTFDMPASTGPAPRPALSAGPPLPARHSTFNRGFLDRKDPVEGSGIWMRQFSFAMSYRVAPEKHAGVLDSLFKQVHSRLRANCIPRAAAVLVDYDDASTGREAARRYVVVRSDTVRSTHMDVYATFRSYGDYLYVSVDSFQLPPLSILRVLWAGFVAMGITTWGWLLTTPIGALFALAGMRWMGWLLGSPLIGFLFITCPLLLWWNREVIRSVRHGDPLEIALRRRYYRWWGAASAFDNDDILAHFKSTVSLIAEEIADVFQKNGIPVEALDQVRQVINQSTTVVNSGVMNVLGSMLVGVGNSLSGASN